MTDLRSYRPVGAAVICCRIGSQAVGLGYRPVGPSGLQMIERGFFLRSARPGRTADPFLTSHCHIDGVKAKAF